MFTSISVRVLFNSARTVSTRSDCFPIAAFESNNLVAIRAAEVAQSLNR